MKISRPLLVIAPTAVLLLAACGSDDDNESDSGAEPGRTIEVEMVDNDFDPSIVDVEVGDTVRLVFENTGEVAHDAFVGDAEAQAAHEEEMTEAAEMGHGAEDDGAITVEPGDTGELVYTFDEPGTLEIGCHEPGHYAAGMKIDVNV